MNIVRLSAEQSVDLEDALNKHISRIKINNYYSISQTDARRIHDSLSLLHSYITHSSTDYPSVVLPNENDVDYELLMNFVQDVIFRNRRSFDFYLIKFGYAKNGSCFWDITQEEAEDLSASHNIVQRKNLFNEMESRLLQIHGVPGAYVKSGSMRSAFQDLEIGYSDGSSEQIKFDLTFEQLRAHFIMVG